MLNRAILSHLLVAVPPAVILGQMVIDINQTTLEHETQLLHLSLASELRDRVTARVDLTASLLGHAERVLDLSTMPIEGRQDVLRALIADRELDYLAIYRPDGTFDTLIQAKDGEPVDRTPLSAELRRRADTNRIGARAFDDGRLLIVMRWEREGETLGYLGTSIASTELHAQARKLAGSYLGDGGVVEIVDERRRYVLSSRSTLTSSTAGEGTPFATIRAEGGALTSLEAGISMVYVDATGEDRLGSVVSAPDVGWLVSASRTKKAAFESIGRMRNRVILMSLVAALAAGIVGLLMARQVTGPITRLIGQVRRVAKRGFDPSDKITAKGELGKLAEAFNAALDELDAYRGQLRMTTQMRLRLGRFVSKGAMHGLLASGETMEMEGPPEQITLLYADVVHRRLPDSPEGTGTEHLVTLLGEFFSAAHESLTSRGGRIDRYSGDAVIGIFGGNDKKSVAAAITAARTLVRDANAIGERWAEVAHVELTASVGVVSGAAVVARADESGQEVTVTGELVDRAAAFQHAAEAGTVWIDDATREALELEGEPVGAVDGQDAFGVNVEA